MLATAQTMLLALALRQLAGRGGDEAVWRETRRSIPADEYRRRVSEYQQKMAGDLLGCLETLQAVLDPRTAPVGRPARRRRRRASSAKAANI